MLENFSGTEIAVVGMAGRFPGARNTTEFWQNLRDGVLSLRPLSITELDDLGIDEATRQDPNFVPVSSAVDDYDKFDAPFFDYTPREAEIMDPQQRVFLESCWEALEDAGYDPQQYQGLIGVFAGSTTSNYLVYNLAGNRQVFHEVDHGQIDIGNGADFVATRVSYKLNLKGPSLSVQTACSTSMVAIHLACQALLNEECDMALAGGVCVHVDHPKGYRFVEGSILSPNGQVNAFDAQANGTVFSSGAGVVVLKRLDDALEQGDHILAVILGSAINNDGSNKVGYVAPSVDGQAEVIIEAMAVADVDADSIDYVETHGAGTRLGDPIEIRALTKAFRTSTERTGFCAVGSVKTNVGHLTGAAGVAGFIKTVLALQHKEIPPLLGFETPNPECFFDQSPFVPNTTLRPWLSTGEPRRAGVSSFGLGGTNVHLILQEEPVREPEPRPSRGWQLVTVCAKTETALHQATENLITYLQAHPKLDFADVTYTLKVGRQGMRYRRMLVCRDADTVINSLMQTPVQSVAQQEKRIVFVLPPATAWTPAGKGLYESESAFADAVDACAEIWYRHTSVDLRYAWERDVTDTAVSLPLHFTRQYALARLWQSWGIMPQALLGYGIGELVCACLSGVLTLPDALAVVARLAKGGSVISLLQMLPLNEPQIPTVSGRSGTWLTAAEATDPAFYDELLMPANIETGLQTITQNPQYILLTLDNALPGILSPFVSLGDADEQAHALTVLGGLWQVGITVDWAAFYGKETRYRVVLPTYPFERQRYWISPDDASTAAKPLLKLTKKGNLAEWLYTPAWRSEAATLPIRFEDLSVANHWLIFMDSLGVGEAITAWLREANQSVTQVQIGRTFGEANDIYTLDPHDPTHYRTLLQKIEPPQHVLHLWQLTEKLLPSDMATFSQNLGTGYHSLLYLAQALGTTATQIDVVTNFTYQVLESEPICPEKAALLGACRVIPQEMGHLSCRLLDIVVPTNLKQWVPTLLGELQTGADAPSLALRGKQRWLPTYTPAPVSATAAAIRPLRVQGVYLIVGGMSDIGLELAKYLAQTVQARLVLVGDEQVEVTAMLRDQGAADVLVVRGDVADTTVLETAVSQALTTFQGLHGVIHVPSIQNDRAFCPIQDVNESNSHWHFTPKVGGLYALAQALTGHTPDFCLVSSALSVALGGVGFATFTAAAAMLDAFVHSRNQTSLFPWLSINWDVWQFAEDIAELQAIGGNLAQLALTPEEGGEILRRVITAVPYTQVLVSTGDLQQRLDEAQHKIESLRGAKHDQSFYDRPDLWTEYVAPRNDAEEKVVAIWQQLLGINKIGINDNFFDLGGHSLLATQLRNHIYETFQVELPIQALLENATPTGVANLVEMHRPSGEMARPLGERLREAFPSERPNIMTEYLRHKLAQGLEISPEQIPANGDLSGFDKLHLATVDLIWNLKQEFKIQFYPHEVMGRPHLPDLAQFLLSQVDRMANLPAFATNKPLSAYTMRKHRDSKPIVPSPNKNKSMVFMLSSPRSGSTIFRVMLAGHPQVFCPPEISLLFFDTMQEWQENVSFGQDFQWPAEGLHWALVDLMNIEPEEGWRVIEQMVTDNRSVPSVYAQLQELAGKRLLVDKTPPYAMDLDTLRRAEARFENAKYVHLVRHPYAMMESFLRVRLDQQFSSSLFEEENPDPYIIAETIWATANRNLLTFLTQEVDPQRYRLVRYEDLVHEPQTTMQQVCDFLEIPFNEAVLHPYDGRKDRMMGGIGDPNIMQHKGIDPKLGDVWKDIRLPRYLDETTKELAAQFGYELPENVEIPDTLSPAVNPIEPMSTETPNVADLSDEEVAAMLQSLLIDGEGA